MVVRPFEDRSLARTRVAGAAGSARRSRRPDQLRQRDRADRLAAAGDDDTWDIRNDPPALGTAGARATARVRVAPRRAMWLGRPVEHQIEVEAPVSQVLAFRQLPSVRRRVPAVMLFAMLALTATPHP